MINLSSEQENVINSSGNLVVVANPGSGKTTTLAVKMKGLLSKLEDYQGVIAISYTRKASSELKNKVLSHGVNVKKSFFGTIDKFCMEEIIKPFIHHIFIESTLDLEISKVGSIEGFPYELKDYKEISDKERLELAIKYIRDGTIILEDTSLLSNYVIQNSEACKRYLKSRYSYILVDEYQDCDEQQHKIFLKLNEMGINCIAVGDINQSIFEYAKKSSRYLIELTNNSQFNTIYMNKNYRCHESISQYAYKFLGMQIEDKQIEDTRVKKITVNGYESDIAKYIENNIDEIMRNYSVINRSDVGILVKSNKTAQIISDSLSMEHRVHKDCSLDKNNSYWANIFKDTLNCVFANQINEYEFINKYFNLKYDLKNVESVRIILRNIEYKMYNSEHMDVIDYFIDIASTIDIERRDAVAIEDLRDILEDDKKLSYYKPVNNNEVQIMTLHKSKGLEFDIVFHTDLYEFILPKITKVNNSWILENESQCKNLHYVGITRARKLCVLVTSTMRTQSNGAIKPATPSRFLNFQV